MRQQTSVVPIRAKRYRAADLGEEIIGLKGLGDIAVHARVKEALAIAA